jgi:DNA-binding HxlR family transcriptional regulator
MGGAAFTARTASLTLLYLASSLERRALLSVLAQLVMGVRWEEDLEPPAEGTVAAADLLELQFIEVADEDALEPDGTIGPETPLRASSAGVELVFVASTLERWLRNRPEGPTRLGEEEAGQALISLVGGWATTVLHALAGEPKTQAEVRAAVSPSISDEVLEERLLAMEASGQVEAFEWEDGETRLELTQWQREAISPLCAAARLEGNHPIDDTAPPDRLDIEAGFQLALPLLELDERLSGSCLLAIQVPSRGRELAGVTVQVEGGRVVSWTTRLDRDADASAIGTAEDWLDAVVVAERDGVKVEGKRRLAHALLEGLYERLFGVPTV